MGIHILQKGELLKLWKLNGRLLKKTMSRVLAGKMQLDFLWNNALDDYEAEGNDGNESLVGDELDLEVLVVIVQKQRSIDLISITKPNTSKPNVAPSITSRPLILHKVREVIVMPSNGLNVWVLDQTCISMGNVALITCKLGTFVPLISKGGWVGFQTSLQWGSGIHYKFNRHYKSSWFF